MEKKDKLKIVFDFISDYLSEESTTNDKNKDNDVNVSLTDNETPYKRSYEIIKKLDEIDKEETELKTKNKLKNTINELNSEIRNTIKAIRLKESFIEEQKSKGLKMLCYDHNNFMPIFLSEDKTHAITINDLGVHKTIDFEELKEKYPGVYNNMINEDNDTRTGLTLDDDGNLIKVSAPKIEESETGSTSDKPPLTRQQWDELIEKTHIKDKENKENNSPNNID